MPVPSDMETYAAPSRRNALSESPKNGKSGTYRFSTRSFPGNSLTISYGPYRTDNRAFARISCSPAACPVSALATPSFPRRGSNVTRTYVSSGWIASATLLINVQGVVVQAR
ncbi:MAG: hypothetical protein FD129_3033 [bacterium]|nr:MAG: hypothetical protein FD129_3033 [bacterium]